MRCCFKSHGEVILFPCAVALNACPPLDPFFRRCSILRLAFDGFSGFLLSSHTSTAGSAGWLFVCLPHISCCSVVHHRVLSLFLSHRSALCFMSVRPAFLECLDTITFRKRLHGLFSNYILFQNFFIYFFFFSFFVCLFDNFLSFPWGVIISCGFWIGMNKFFTTLMVLRLILS